MLEHALKYASLGIAVFPCRPDKSPITPHGHEDASTGVDVITAYWARDPGALIGGAIPRGYVVIDLDPRNGSDETVTALASLGVKFPPTLSALTGSKGRHKWYRISPQVELKGTAGLGIDVKRHGKGYVILPPSVSDAGPYHWQQGEPDFPRAKRLPEAARAYLTKREVAERRPADFTPTRRPDWLKATAYGDSALANQGRAILAAVDGERNNVLNSAAFGIYQLAHGGEIDEDYASEFLAELAEEVGLSKREIKRTLKSAYEAAADDPRAAPPVDPAKPSESLSEPLEGHFWTDWQVEEAAPPFYLYPLLPKNAYVLVYGATEAAKSMVWKALLTQASHYGIRSSVYSLENPAHVDRERLRRLGPDPANFRISHAGLNLADFAQAEALVTREQAWHTDVILLDTYSHAFASRSEDGNAKAIAFSKLVRYIMAEVGCSVVVIDHTGYMQKEEPRDASAKRQAVDVAILMEKDGAWSKGSPARFRMSNYKAARFANPFYEVRGAVIDTDKGGLALDWLDKDFSEGWQV